MKAWWILFYTVIPQTNNIFIWGCKTPSYSQISTTILENEKDLFLKNKLIIYRFIYWCQYRKPNIAKIWLTIFCLQTTYTKKLPLQINKFGDVKIKKNYSTLC